MRALTLAVLVPGLAAIVSAQGPMRSPMSTTVRPMPAPPNAHPYGNILFPGGTPGHAGALGGTVSGTVPYTGVPPYAAGRSGGYGYNGGRNRTVVVPYAVPMYTGPGYGYYDYGQQTPTNVTVVVPQQPAPPVIINQTFGPDNSSGRQELREYSSTDVPEQGGLRVYEPGKRSEPVQRRTEAPAPENNGAAMQRQADPGIPAGSYVRDGQPTIYLIALKDTTVRQAIGYWVDGNTLHYVTPQASINHLSLDMVDKDLSAQLNAERKLDFDLRPR